MVQSELTTGEAAKTSGLSVSTIKRKIQSKELKASRSEQGEWTVHHADLMAFLSVQKQPNRKGASGRPLNSQNTELIMNHSENVERELVELRREKAKLELKVERLQEENRSLMLEYKAMIERMIDEKNHLIKEMRDGPSSEGKEKDQKVDVPSRFLSKIRKVAQAIRE